MSFFVELWESVFTPGTSPALIKATHGSFILLLLSLLFLIYYTRSIHFINLFFIASFLYAAVIWFINELKNVKLKENQELAKEGDKNEFTEEKDGAVDEPETVDVGTTQKAASARKRKRGLSTVHDQIRSAQLVKCQCFYMFRHALLKYIEHPENDDAVLFFTDDYVILRDAYPKALRHYLVMPRGEAVTHTHPLVALRDAQFIDNMQDAVKRARRLLVEDLVKAGILEDAESAEYEKTFVRAGVHSVPSMSNLHIHVISQDFYLPLMKNKKHYNSFTTPFFVDFPEGVVDADQPLDTDSSCESETDQEQLVVTRGKLMLGQRKSSRGKSPDFIRDSPLQCTYCHRQYGNKFSKLKGHLAEEFARKFGTQDAPH